MRRFDRFEIRPGVRRLFRIGRQRHASVHAEAREEIDLHLQLRAEQLMQTGLSAADARREAERRFGASEPAVSSAHDRERRHRWRDWLDVTRQNFRIATRGLLRAPAFTTTAVLCLALGVGANAATFALFDELLLRPLPVPEPERLVNLGAPGPRPGRDNWTQSGPAEWLFSHPMFRDLSQARPTVVGLAAHRLFYANVAYEGRPEFGVGTLVSGSYFPILGVKPMLGRLLGPEDDRTPGAHPIAVVSHAYWTSALGSDPGVVGTTLLVNGQRLTIVGVAPEGFEGTTLRVHPRVFVPLAMAGALDPTFGPPSGFDNRRWYWLYVFGRLRSDATIADARAELNTIYRRSLLEIEAPLQHGMSETTLARFKERQLTVEEGRRGQSVLHGQTRTPLLLLFAITGLVVLIAAANVANLLLARAATRSTEMAVRLSLGAGRRRLLAQTLTESLLLAAVGALASLLVARGLLLAIGALIPPIEFGAAGRLTLELRPSVLGFAAAVALGTGLLFGLVPALHSSRPDLIESLKAGSGKLASTRHLSRFRTWLVTSQIAVSMTLLIGAGLFIKSLRNVTTLDLGIDVDRVAMFAIAPVFNGYDPARSRALFDRVEDELAAVPGVSSVGASSVALLTGSTRGGDIRVSGFTASPDTDVNTRQNEVGVGYFRALGMPILLGRDFSPADRLGTPKVAIVNQAFARKFNLGSSPLGRRIAFARDGPDAPLETEIVGLVGDTRYSGVRADEPPIVYRPYRQEPQIGASFFYVRTSADPTTIFPTVRRIVSRLDPNLPVVALKTLEQQARENVYLDRMIGMLSAGFAALATLLAAVGLYGVLAYSVAQRTREIGLRMALGADGSRVRRMVLSEVGRMTALGAVVGIGAALAVGRVADSLLFGLTPHDATVFGAAVIALGIVSAAAGFVPAWRAARVAPLTALRGE